jgi:hypothetical protein
MTRKLELQMALWGSHMTGFQFRLSQDIRWFFLVEIENVRLATRTENVSLLYKDVITG